MNGFDELKVIGDGSFSVVYRGKRRADGELYAIKKVKLSCLSASEKLNCLNEVRLLAAISHPNVIQYKQAFFQGDHLCLVTEYAQGGDFLQFMLHRRKAKQPFTEEEMCVYAREMASGLNGLHRTNILHRDVKAANFFIVGDRIKIGDMNVSSISKDGMASTKIGTPFYTSPEIWQQLPYSGKSDIWSLGCLLYQMLTFMHPFSGKDLHELKQNVLHCQYAPLPQNTPSQLAEIVKMCLQKEASDRPSAQQLLANKYLKRKYNQCKQKTMEKSLMNEKDHKQACKRILKQINSASCEVSKALLPKPNYINSQHTSQSLPKKKKRSASRQLTSRLLTMYSIYNQKPPSLPNRYPKATLLR